MEQTLTKSDMSNILSKVPFEKGFHFTSQKGGYTGTTATSLLEFSAKLETIDVDSIEFHYPRGDFQKWIQDTLGDKELADRLCFVPPNLAGEKLRKQLLKIVQKRISEVKKK